MTDNYIFKVEKQASEVYADYYDSSYGVSYDELNTYDEPRTKSLKREQNCDSKNKFCVCDEMGFPPFSFSECRRDANNTVVVVRDGCYRKQDNFGYDICYLNGCGDILIGLDENTFIKSKI